MTFTYSGDPSSDPRDEVRFLLGDTVETAHSLSDDEVDYLLGTNGDDPYRAASAAALRVATYYTGQAVTQKRIGELTLSYDYAATGARYEALAARLATGKPGSKLAPLTSEDKTSHIFSIGMDDGNLPYNGGTGIEMQRWG